MKRQRLATVFAASAMALCCSSCIGAEAPVGAAAVSLDTTGQIVVTLETCGERIGTVTLAELASNPNAEDPVIAQWTNDAAGTGSRALQLMAPDSEWSVEQPMPDLQPGVTYSISAQYPEIDYGGTSAQFTLDGLNSLGKDQVMAFDEEIRSLTEFKEWASS